MSTRFRRSRWEEDQGPWARAAWGSLPSDTQRKVSGLQSLDGRTVPSLLTPTEYLLFAGSGLSGVQTRTPAPSAPRTVPDAQQVWG